jgi:hypothetical protein
MVVNSSVLVIDPRSDDGLPLIICTECGKDGLYDANRSNHGVKTKSPTIVPA